MESKYGVDGGFNANRTGVDLPARNRIRKRRHARVSRNPVVPLAREDMEHLIANARKLYADMRRFEPERADRIAIALFHELTSPFRNHPKLLKRISGISDVTLWQWRIGRNPVHADTISRHSDRLARGLGLPKELAQEAANLMSGLPWLGNKTGRELLRYVVEHGLEPRTLLYLARRQERMNIVKFARMMGIPKDLLSSMSSPPEYDPSHRGKRGNLSVTRVAKRFGLTGTDEIAAFRLLATRGTAIPRVSQSQLAAVFHGESEKLPRPAFLLRFLTLLRDRHGLPGRRSLVDAIWEVFSEAEKASASMGPEPFKQRLTSNTHAREPSVHIPRDWAEALAALAFPGKRYTKLRLALARYLENRDDSHKRTTIQNPKGGR